MSELAAINYIESGKRTEFAYDGMNRRVKITEKGSQMKAVVQPAGSSYTLFATAPFVLSESGSYTLSFAGLNPNGGDNTAFIDAVTLNDTLVSNGGFETPNVGSSFFYNPSGATWSFTGNSGISGNGSGFTSGNPNAPEGTQVGLVQFDGVISQTLSVAAGTYTLGFEAAQRGNYNASHQQLRVTVQPYPLNDVVKTFIWCGNTICEERNSTGSTVTKRFFAEGEKRIGGSDAGNYFYSRDHLGSIREVTDSTGALKAQYDYDSWGNAVVVSGNMNVDFGFTGHYFHQPSGMNLTLYRAYSPTFGRWISRDPIGESGGLNLYGYVSNDPLRNWDPIGLCCDSQTIAKGRAQLESNYSSAMILARTVLSRFYSDPASASCIDKNCFDIYPNMGPIPQCWECHLEHRFTF